MLRGGVAKCLKHICIYGFVGLNGLPNILLYDQQVLSNFIEQLAIWKIPDFLDMHMFVSTDKSLELLHTGWRVVSPFTFSEVCKLKIQCLHKHLSTNPKIGKKNIVPH